MWVCVCVCMSVCPCDHVFFVNQFEAFDAGVAAHWEAIFKATRLAMKVLLREELTDIGAETREVFGVLWALSWGPLKGRIANAAAEFIEGKRVCVRVWVSVGVSVIIVSVIIGVGVCVCVHVRVPCDHVFFVNQFEAFDAGVVAHWKAIFKATRVAMKVALREER